jgi:hypothetical protein
MGHQDPLDGFVTYNQLQATAAKASKKSARMDLNAEIIDMGHICEGKNWTTDDPLGIGGLLFDACRVAQMLVNEDFKQNDFLEILLDSSLPGLESYVRKNPIKFPAEYRLAFRELGLSIGLGALEKVRGILEANPDLFTGRLHSRIEKLMRYAPLSANIKEFWLRRENRKSNSWMEHRDINMVTLATSLAPEGFLTL